MKMLLFIPVFLFVFWSCQSTSENKVIFILHDESNSSYLLSIAEPLDGAFNNEIGTFKETITDSSRVEFTYKKKYPAIISVDVTGRKFYVVMSSGTSVYVDIYPQHSNDDWIVFRGDNAAGQQLYNVKPYGKFGLDIQQIFRDNGKDYSTINKHINDYVDAALYTVDSLKTLKKISDSFADVLKKDRLAMLYEKVIDYYNYLFFVARGDRFTTTDSIAIRSSQDKIFSTFSPLAPDIPAYMYGLSYLFTYGDIVYYKIDIKSDKRFISVFNNDTYGGYGLLPDNLQKPLLGHLIVNQYFFHINEFDKTKVTTYFREKYPDSEYLPIIDKMAEKYKQSQVDLAKEKNQADTISSTNENSVSNKKITNNTTPNSDINIDTSTVAMNIRTLKELHETYFKGKKIFIDLWATWCKPCREEFVYRVQLDSLLKQYNITPVLLSMDSPSFKKQWVQFIYYNKITGYHFIINQSLINDIRNLAGYSNPVSALPLPHFIYINEHGNIVEKNAPRPGEIGKLAELFNKE